MKKRILWLILPILCLLISGCEQRKPDGVLSKDAMTDVLVDYHIAHTMAENLPADKRYQAPLLIEGALQKHHITQAEFDSSLIWYTRNLSELSLVYNRVNRIIAEKTDELAQETDRNHSASPANTRSAYASGAFPEGDSVDIWRQPTFFQMNRIAATRRMQFVLTPDQSFMPDDILTWELNARVLPKDQKGGKAVMLLMARYSPDSVLISSRIITRSGKYSLTLRNHSAQKITQIWGFLHYFPGEGKANAHKRMFFDRIRLMRYRSKS